MDPIPDFLKNADLLLARVNALQTALDDLRSALRGHRETLERHLSGRSALPTPPSPPAGQKPGMFQRAVPRWPANHVQLCLCGEDEDVFTGEAIDFSTAGLAVLAPISLPVHSILKLKLPAEPGHAPAEVIVRVRNSRPEGKRWLTGCQFDTPLSPLQLQRLGLSLPPAAPAAP